MGWVRESAGLVGGGLVAFKACLAPKLLLTEGEKERGRGNQSFFLINFFSPLYKKCFFYYCCKATGTGLVINNLIVGTPMPSKHKPQPTAG